MSTPAREWSNPFSSVRHHRIITNSRFLAASLRTVISTRGFRGALVPSSTAGIQDSMRAGTIGFTCLPMGAFTRQGPLVRCQYRPPFKINCLHDCSSLRRAPYGSWYGRSKDQKIGSGGFRWMRMDSSALEPLQIVVSTVACAIARPALRCIFTRGLSRWIAPTLLRSGRSVGLVGYSHSRPAAPVENPGSRRSEACKRTVVSHMRSSSLAEARVGSRD